MNPMKSRLLVTLTLFQLAITLGFGKTGEAAWAHQASDIPPDARLHFGQLENGFRYVTMQHKDPPERVSIRLYVAAGSLQEADEQRGLAHFLEHMAFNGTRNYKGTEIIEFLQRLGMAFGPDINAHTSFDETVYKLDLPDVKEETIDQGLTIMRDWADGMLLDKEEIDKERGVILKEKLGRDSIRFRLMEAEINFLFPDSRLPHRIPIGLEKVIQEAPRERFVDFYQTYYNPQNMILVVVGDIDQAAIEAKVKAQFREMKRHPKVAPPLDMGKLTAAGLRTKVQLEAEASGVQVSLTSLQPYAAKPDNEAARAADLPLSLANAIMNRRLSILAKNEDAPFTSGGAYSADFYKIADMANVELRCLQGQWQGALTTAEQEIRRAVEHGFTGAELKEAKAELLNAYERALETAATRKASSIANEIVSSFGDKSVYSSPEDDLRITRSALGAITEAQCQEAFRKHWATDHLQIMLSGNLKDAANEGDVSKVFLASKQQAVEAPKEEAQQEFAYRDFGPLGQVTDREEVEDLGITQLSFKNGVRVNLKPTDFEKDSIRVAAFLGAGKLTQPKDQPGIDMFASSLFEAGGLEKHSADDLQRLFAGKNVGVGFGVDDDTFMLSGRTTSEDLLDQLQLMCAHLVAAGYRKEAELQMRKMLPMIEKQIETLPQGVMQARVDRFVHGDDSRFGIPGSEGLAKLNMAEVETWLDPQLKKAPLELSLVGDFEISQVIPLLQQTFGALPDRDTKQPDYTEERKVTFPAGIREKEFLYESKLGKSLTLVYWPTTDRSDIGVNRRLSVLSTVLEDRIRKQIREELGEAYSPGAHHIASDAFPGYGVLFAMSPGSTEKSDLVAARIVEIGAKLAAEGTNADELERSLKPVQTSLKEQRRSNTYWLSSVLGRSQEDPRRLDWARSMEEDFQKITVEDINALAKQYLLAGRSLKVIIKTNS